MSNTYIVKQIEKKDGVTVWDNVMSAPINQALWLPDIGIMGSAKVCYDDSNLYVHLEVIEKDITARHTGLYDMICEDSCLEFFLSPMAGDSRYFNFELNPNGAIYVGFGYNNPDNIRLFVSDVKHKFSISPFSTENGWGVEFTVPVSFIQTFFPTFVLTSGLELRGNFYKCGDLTPTPHYVAWNEIKCEKPDFHRPEYFGKLILE